MAAKQTVLVETVPLFTRRGNRFYVDLEMDRIPDFALDPNTALRIAVALHRLFVEWQASNEADVIFVRHYDDSEDVPTGT